MFIQSNGNIIILLFCGRQKMQEDSLEIWETPSIIFILVKILIEYFRLNYFFLSKINKQNIGFSSNMYVGIPI